VPRLLDLFCCEGGAARGYADAGFEVVGVDIERQPRYPFEFHQGDAMTWPLAGFDAVHASPPCQDHSALSTLQADHGTGWMLSATVERLTAWGGPWIVENVAGADMPGALTLCGSEFGLGAVDKGRYRHLKRHRQFLSNVLLMGAGGCHCHGRRIGGVYGNGGGGEMARGFKFSLEPAREAHGDAVGIPYGRVAGHPSRLHPLSRRAVDRPYPLGGRGMKRGTNYIRRMAPMPAPADVVAVAGTAEVVRRVFTSSDCQDCGRPIAQRGHEACVEPEEMA
jgi:DNA (cytosine-5)-methyltransferase 1